MKNCYVSVVSDTYIFYVIIISYRSIEMDDISFISQKKNPKVKTTVCRRTLGFQVGGIFFLRNTVIRRDHASE